MAKSKLKTTTELLYNNANKTTSKTSLTCLLILSVLVMSCTGDENQNYSVHSVSAMKNVMWKGELEAKISLDTILPQKGFYGLGPAENLSGEITVIDGISYVSEIDSLGEINVSINNRVGAPFFVYAMSNEFQKIRLPENVKSLKSLDTFLQNNFDPNSSFLFKIRGSFDSAKIHVQNLPEGSVVNSPKEAHQGQINFQINKIEGELIGFYSNKDHGVFTHHDTNIHTHFLSKDQKYMGHCDELSFNPDDVNLYISLNR